MFVFVFEGILGRITKVQSTVSTDDMLSILIVSKYIKVFINLTSHINITLNFNLSFFSNLNQTFLIHLKAF